MPGAVETDCNMEKKKKSKSRRKRVPAIEQESSTVVAGLFTLEKAYGKHTRSKLNGGMSSKLDAMVRDCSADARRLVHGEPSSSFVVSSQADTSSTEKGTGLLYQESCITEDESASGNSRDIESSKLAILQRIVSGNDLDQNQAGRGKTKRRRMEEDVNAEGEDGELPVELRVKAQKISEEARVWQYVCKRSVFVSPPQRPHLPDKKQDKKDLPLPSGSAPFPSILSQFGVNDVFEEKTVNVEVAVNDRIVKVTLTKETSVAQEWIEQQTGNCFGLDLEWKPTFRKGQKESKVALMQISSETECLLVQMLFLDSIPSALVQFLEDPERKIAGVGIHQDTKKLCRDFGLICGGEVELTALAVDHYKNDKFKRAGLKALAKHVLGYDMNKSKDVTMSNWSKPHLNRRQVEYACIDAWVSHAIFGRLQKSLVLAA